MSINFLPGEGADSARELASAVCADPLEKTELATFGLRPISHRLYLAHAICADPLEKTELAIFGLRPISHGWFSMTSARTRTLFF